MDEAREILREATLAANEQARMELTRGMSADADADAAAIECLRVEAFLRARGGPINPGGTRRQGAVRDG